MSPSSGKFEWSSLTRFPKRGAIVGVGLGLIIVSVLFYTNWMSNDPDKRFWAWNAITMLGGILAIVGFPSTWLIVSFAAWVRPSSGPTTYFLVGGMFIVFVLQWAALGMLFDFLIRMSLAEWNSNPRKKGNF
jgi:hypothetical protein